MHRTLAEKLLAIIAIIGIIVTDASLVACLFGYVGFNPAMLITTVSGIIAALSGGIYLLARLADIERRRLST